MHRTSFQGLRAGWRSLVPGEPSAILTSRIGPSVGRAAAIAALLAALAPVVLAPSSAGAQSLEDGVLLPGRTLGIGVMASQNAWHEYWEGARKRDNENIGTLTSRSVTVMAAYGVTDRIGVVAMLPYVETRASQGTLQGMKGAQDLLIGAKYRLGTASLSERGRLSVFAAAAVASPVSDYSPDFLPLSIGLGSRRAQARLTARLEAGDGWYVDGSSAYTWRGNVSLDRDSYFTDGRLYETSKVSMPAVFDYSVSAGYRAGRLHVPVRLYEQRTLGGGDIRRQDMPFVSNRMNFVEAGAGLGYMLPGNVSLQVGGGRVIRGRNVGQTTRLFGGIQYMHPF